MPRGNFDEHTLASGIYRSDGWCTIVDITNNGFVKDSKI
jgi:hypothetical protein